MAEETKRRGRGSTKGEMPPVMVLGEQEGLVCEVEVVRETMAKLHREVLRVLGAA